MTSVSFLEEVGDISDNSELLLLEQGLGLGLSFTLNFLEMRRACSSLVELEPSTIFEVRNVVHLLCFFSSTGEGLLNPSLDSSSSFPFFPFLSMFCREWSFQISVMKFLRVCFDKKENLEESDSNPKNQILFDKNLSIYQIRPKHKGNARKRCFFEFVAVRSTKIHSNPFLLPIVDKRAIYDIFFLVFLPLFNIVLHPFKPKDDSPK